MANIAVFTIGCKVNQGESEELKMRLAEAGHQICSDPSSADLCVVNTCTVTAESDHKCRKVIRSLGRRGARAIVAAGCYTEVSPDDLEGLPGVVAIIPNSAKGSWDREIIALLHGTAGEEQPAGLSRTRAFIKVQDGCERGCSYCIVPRARGGEWSRPLEDILGLATRWLHKGSRELVLCGINLGRYKLGPDFDLGRLVQEVLSLGEGFRVRLSSIELEDMDISWLGNWAALGDAVCPHLHFPLQSGDAGILEDMGRGYRPADFLEACRLARAEWPRVALTTEVIVGYPGESDEAFERTVDVLKAMAPARVHVFRFSRRPGTRAWDKTELVAPEVIEERSARLRRLAEECRLAYAKGTVGRMRRLLVERILERNGGAFAMGTTEDYIKCIMEEPPDIPRVGSLIDARVIGLRDGLALLEPRKW